MRAQGPCVMARAPCVAVVWRACGVWLLQFYFKDSYPAVKAEVLAADPGLPPKQVAATVMKLVGGRWKAADADCKAEYQARAAADKQRREDEIRAADPAQLVPAGKQGRFKWVGAAP